MTERFEGMDYDSRALAANVAFCELSWDRSGRPDPRRVRRLVRRPRKARNHAAGVGLRAGLDRTLRPDGPRALSDRQEDDASLGPFDLQLLLNAAWTFVFFGRRSPVGGVVVIAALWVAIVATIVSFARVNRVAAVLLVPYLLWVSFASYLNVSISATEPLTTRDWNGSQLSRCGAVARARGRRER